MSFFRKLFGCKKKKIKEPSSSQSTEVDDLKKLQSTEQLLREKREVLETNINKEKVTVKKNIIKNKQVALNAFNRKNRYKEQLSQNDSKLSTIIDQQSVLESANTHNVVVDVMRSTSYAVKMANRNAMEDIHDIIDDIETSQNLTQEISEAICIPIRLETDEDEEELQKELENLELEKLNEQVTNIDPVLTTNYPMPAVPTFVPSRRIKKNKQKQTKNSTMT